MTPGFVHSGSGPQALRRPSAIVALALVVLAACIPARAQILLKEPPPEVQGAGLEERLGEQVPPDVVLMDDRGMAVKLGDYLDGERPVILAMVYYDCPLVCPLVLERIGEGIDGLDYTAGEDFRLVVVSFDSTNTTDMAAREKAVMLAGYGRDQTEAVKSGFAFHTASEGNARKLGDAIGFTFRFLPDAQEFSHPVALTVLTPDGRVSRYIYGFTYDPKDLKLALLEASEGKIAKSIGDFFLHFCYRYDPSAGAYTLQAMSIMRIGGVVTIVFIVALIGTLKLGERRRRLRKGRTRPVRTARAQPAPVVISATPATGHVP